MDSKNEKARENATEQERDEQEKQRRASAICMPHIHQNYGSWITVKKENAKGKKKNSSRRSLSFLALFQVVCCRRCSFRFEMTIDSFGLERCVGCGLLGGRVGGSCVGIILFLRIEHVFNPFANFTFSCRQLNQRLFLLLLFLGNVLVSDGLPAIKKVVWSEIIYVKSE